MVLKSRDQTFRNTDLQLLVRLLVTALCWRFPNIHKAPSVTLAHQPSERPPIPARTCSVLRTSALDLVRVTAGHGGSPDSTHSSGGWGSKLPRPPSAGRPPILPKPRSLETFVTQEGGISVWLLGVAV